MQNKINSATRLQATLIKAHQIPDSTQVLEGWCRIFDIHETNSSRKAIATSALLQILNKECEIATIGLQRLGTPHELYKAAFSNIEHALSPILLSAAWNNISHSLAVESRLFINPLDEQVGPASAPLLECLNGREMIESPLGNAVVVGRSVMSQRGLEFFGAGEAGLGDDLADAAIERARPCR